MNAPDDIIAQRGVVHNFPARVGQGQQPIIATPLRWIEPKAIPCRKFLFASRHAASGLTSATGAVGGAGKSTVLMAEAIAHAAGLDLLGDVPLFRGKSWILGLEDSAEEHQRRFAATMLLHKVDYRAIEGRLFLDTADQGFVIAYDRGRGLGLDVVEPVIGGIVTQIREHDITFLVVDPFVACHGVSENDNSAINAVARLWGQIARETGCAIELVHHLRKGNGGEPTADDFRGASSLLAAVRSARLLATMTKEEAGQYDVDEPFRFVRMLDAKANMRARSSMPVWRELVAVDLGNGDPGDHVAAAARWQPPDAGGLATDNEILAIKRAISEGNCRADSRSKSWAGNAVAQVLQMDLRDPTARAQVTALLRSLIKRGLLVIRKRQDPKQRKEFDYVEVVE